MEAVCEQSPKAQSYRRSFPQIMKPMSKTRMIMIMAVIKRC
jgi:hypothetical protein